jgi:hypothetical protein
MSGIPELILAAPRGAVEGIRTIRAMPFLEELIRDIEGRIREVSREISSLQDARAALVANGAGRSLQAESPAPRPRRRSRRGRARQKRAGRERVLRAETAERVLAESDGLSTAALAQQTEADRDQVLALLRDLESAQRVRRTGQRRGTRWHAITDEDRIQERAADLANRGSSGRAR